jgi:hypothetical protein
MLKVIIMINKKDYRWKVKRNRNHPQLTRKFVEKAVNEYLSKGKTITVLKNNNINNNKYIDYQDSDYLYTGNFLTK